MVATVTGRSEFETLEAVEAQMEAWVGHAFFEAPFFQTLANGAYTLSQLRYFATQYGHYSRHFPRVLGAAISAMAPIPRWWMPLADNLWDEAGRGVPGRSHAELYERFWLSVDPDAPRDADGVAIEPMGPAVGHAIETFLEFFRTAPPLAAMAAVGLGSEFFAGSVMGFIGKALTHPHYQQERSIDVRFWTMHADQDEPRHYQLCRGILAEQTSPADLAMFWQVGRYIAQSEADMYTAWDREMRTNRT